MTRALSLDDQIKGSAMLAARARIHCGLWWTFASKDSREKFCDAFDEYWSALRFVEHANFVSFIVMTHNLFHDRAGTINFRQISKQLDGLAADLIDEVTPIAKKIRTLRNELFAHRSDKFLYEAVFARANLTGNQMISLADAGVKISSVMLQARGLENHPTGDISVAEMERMLADLQRVHETRVQQS